MFAGAGTGQEREHQKNQPLNEATVYCWMKDTPPVRYRLSWIDTGYWDSTIFSSQVHDINDQGIAVGRLYWLPDDGSTILVAAAFRWTEQTGLQQLDELNRVWIDLTTGGVVTGWRALTAWDINEAGQLVGTAGKEGEESRRAFLLDEAVGYYLLPTTASDDSRAASINEAGDVIGEHAGGIFFWTPLNPLTLTPLLPGYTLPSYTKMSDDHFVIQPADSDVPILYFYSVGTDGTLTYQLDADLSIFWRVGGMSRNSLVPFLQRFVTPTSTTCAVGIFDGNSRQITTSMSSNSSLPGTNISADLTFNGTDGIGRLYRHLEHRTYNLYDLLDDSARSQLYTGRIPKSLYDIGHIAVINNSNVANVPTADSFDHIDQRLRRHSPPQRAV